MTVLTYCDDLTSLRVLDDTEAPNVAIEALGVAAGGIRAFSCDANVDLRSYSMWAPTLTALDLSVVFGAPPPSRFKAACFSV